MQEINYVKKGWLQKQITDEVEHLALNVCFCLFAFVSFTSRTISVIEREYYGLDFMVFN